MSSSGLKKLRSFDMKNRNSNSSEIDINSLNDDCLIKIFEELTTFEDKLKVEMVCKRWNRVGKLSWSNVKTLSIKKRFKCGIKQYHPVANGNLFINVIQRCGRYLNDLYIINNFTWNTAISSEMIIKHCKNLNKFNLISLCSHKEFGDEKNLKILFENNINLTTVTLNTPNLEITDCLSSLRLDQLTELKIKCNIFGSVDYFCDLFSKIINLKTFHIQIYSDDDSKNMIYALNKNNYQDLEDLALLILVYNSNYELMTNIVNLIVSQKNLCKLDSNCSLSEKDFDFLKLDSITSLRISFQENIPNSIANFKNLTFLKCSLNTLTDECVKILIKCSNLKEINLTIRINELTNEGENNLSGFKKLEYFEFHSYDKDVSMENILKNVFLGENLKTLYVNHRNTIDPSIIISNISKLKNLNFLDIAFSKVTNDQIIHIVSQLESLKTIFINVPKDLTYDLIKSLDGFKIKRGDKNLLKVLITDWGRCTRYYTVDRCKYKEEFNDFKLISVRYHDIDNSKSYFKDTRYM